MSFVHLHVHAEGSLLDSAARVTDLVARAKELGMDALAITDHGVMFKAVDFYKECKKQGIKPIIGCEVYTAARTRFDKDADLDKRIGHLILLAENNTGYHNLIKIVSEGYRNGFYRKPRIDKEVLRDHHEGLIATSACLAGDVQHKLLEGDYEGAKKEALEMQEIFGEGNYFLEIQDQGLEEEAQILPGMKRLHEETGIPFVATNDVHYVNREDAEAQDVLLCIQTATTVQEENRMRFANDQFYFKSEEEMRKIFCNIPEAVDNTQKIADRCNVEIEFGKLHLPEFKAPDNMTNMTYLKTLCQKGLNERYQTVTPELKERLEYELKTIADMGYVEYFLIVWDFVNYAKSKGIEVGKGRGSASGSLVSYCLKITDIDPIKYGLIFERFLNPERVSMPDIDIDFCYERRGEVVDYVKEKYGKDNVSQITALGTMKAKQAIRDVGRALGVSYAETDTIAKAVPSDNKITLQKALDTSPDFLEMYRTNPTAKKVIDMAMAIEGMPRHASTHAAGVVISKLPIDEYVPLYRGDKGLATQFDMVTIEELGLLKMDFLGLKTLTLIRDALEMIKENHGTDVDFSKMEYNDPEVFNMIQKGNTQGIFQLEGAGITQFMKNLKPDCFEDIIAGISLYRPGPMAFIPRYIENKKHPDKITYIHESLKPILEETYGCIVYQEQVMKIVRELGGYTYGQADLVRRAMSKKKMDVMLKEREHFLSGCRERDIPDDASNEIFDQMISFAEYAFNKAHAASYAIISYETAYLKTYYPTEFMAALMSSVMNDSASLAGYIRNCKDMGIEILPPDVLMSQKKFSAKDGKIRYGLMAVKNVGSNAIDSIINARKTGTVTNIYRLIHSVDLSVVNKRAVESLIKAGALDCFGETRSSHMAAYEKIADEAHKAEKKMMPGQMSLFDTNADAMNAKIFESLPDREEYDIQTISAMEKEVLGVYLTAHPLEKYRELIGKRATLTSRDLLSAAEDRDKGILSVGIRDGQKAVIAGVIDNVKTLITKKGKMMAFLTLEDMYGLIEVVVFPKEYESYSASLREGNLIFVTGEVDFKENSSPKILTKKITSFESAQKLQDKHDEIEKAYKNHSADTEKAYTKEPAKGVNMGNMLVKIRLTEGNEITKTFDKIRAVLLQHSGQTPVIIYFPGGRTAMAKDKLRVTPSQALKSKLITLVGSKNVKFDIRK